jgi:multidrug efflux pump subunit AcrA (membrane-fusion protein)
MPAEYDASEFVDHDLTAPKSPYAAASSLASALQRAPSREEVDLKVADAQQKLAELKRAQEELERERAALEETRRRQLEFQNGRQEMIQHLTRGLGLLEEAEFGARHEAEQMGRSLGEFREALTKLQAIHEETWNKDNFIVELTRALTTIENARMEWNTARLKFPVLAQSSGDPKPATPPAPTVVSPFEGRSFMELCQLGLALTWPLAAVALLALGVLIVVLVTR